MRQKPSSNKAGNRVEKKNKHSSIRELPRKTSHERFKGVENVRDVEDAKIERAPEIH